MKTLCVRPIVSLAVAAGLAALCASPAAAQTPVNPVYQAQPVGTTAKPYQSLFGASHRSDPETDQFALNLSLSEERGDLQQQAVLVNPGVPVTSGVIDGLLASLTYDHRRKHSTVALIAEGNFRYYRDIKTSAPSAWHVDFAASTTPNARTTFTFGQSVIYTPYFAVPSLPATPAGQDLIDLPTVGLPVTDNGMVRQDETIYLTSAGLTRQLSQRWLLALDAQFGYYDLALVGSDVRDLRVGGGLGRQLTRNLTLRFAYAYRLGNLAADTLASRAETQDAGINFDYQLPRSRTLRTTLSFGAGATRLSADVTGPVRVAANFTLRQDLSRRWFIAANYNRGYRFAPGFLGAWFSDSIGARLGGSVGRRVELSATAGYVKGETGTDAAGSFDLWQASAQMRIALFRYMAVDAAYTTYRHVMNENVPLIVDIARDFSRHALRINLTIWLPLTH